ncbi:MAG TPA: MGMT family protein [Chloroflexota bacterium]|nr:MGMT family protein [Chloroflexota bacterium]
MRSFPEQVYAIVLAVPRGRVITYGAIARLLGDPRKARQVGWAMAATPDDRRPRIPAHRVIKASGGLPSGHEAHRARLESEGVRFLDDGRVDLEAHFWMPTEPSAVRKQKSDGPPKRNRLTSEF